MEEADDGALGAFRVCDVGVGVVRVVWRGVCLDGGRGVGMYISG